MHKLDKATSLAEFNERESALNSAKLFLDKVHDLPNSPFKTRPSDGRLRGVDFYNDVQLT
jgi:hypothetical protein